MIGTLNKVGSIEETHLSTIEATCDKPTANVRLSCEKLKTIPLRLGTR